MKKNVMMRAASVMLVLVLLTSSVISGTFAKYVTSETGTDSARVAKWGVNITAEGTTFAESYDGVGDGNDAADTANVTVRSDKTHGNVNDLVAPGTKGDMAAIALSGKPEVDVRITYSADVTLTGWEYKDEYYCPLIIYINNTPYYAAGAENAESFAATIENAIADYAQEYDANTDLSTVGNANLKVSWEWPFETVIDGELCDEKDTYLGDAAAGEYAGKGAATISIEVTTTATQID